MGILLLCFSVSTNLQSIIAKMEHANKEQEQHIVSLERLLTFHRNNSGFTYVNDHNNQERISIKSQSNLPEDTMRSLWAIFDKTYFKDIDRESLQILNCLNKTENDVVDCYELQRDEEFQAQLAGVFSREYLTSERIGPTEQLLHENFIDEMYIHWNFARSSAKHQSQYQNFQSRLESIRKNEKMIDISLEQKQLYESYLKDVIKLKGFSHDFSSYERSMIDLAESNSILIQNIYEGIKKEMQKCRDSLKNKSSQDEQLGQIDEYVPLISSVKRQKERKTLLKFLKYQIGNLQKKQIAESITKIISKRVESDQNVYKVSLELSMNAENVQFTESQLIELNRYRDTSLFQFYHVGWKSKFNYVCQNYLGFQILHARPKTQAHLLKSTTILPLLSESKQILSNQADLIFSEMQTCHECKLLYNKNILTKCSYKSSSQNNSFPYYFDPYVYFLLRNKSKNNEISVKIQQEFIEKSPYRYYSFKNGEYECGRYYCKMCIKNYNGHHCKFCQMVCICSRCVRNAMITRLLTIYCMLGGDVRSLTKESIFSKLEEQRQHEMNRTVVQTNVQVIQPLREKIMASYKMQLEELRLLSHMVMRRESIKEQQFLNEVEIFKEKLKTCTQK